MHRIAALDDIDQNALVALEDGVPDTTKRERHDEKSTTSQGRGQDPIEHRRTRYLDSRPERVA